jgi:hypothetical protein
MRPMIRAATLLALAAIGAAASAGAPDAVEVTALRHPVDKSYRRMVQGMELFEGRHALAPRAMLRYKLLPRSKSIDLRNLEVQIVGKSFERPVRVAADQTFSLERDPQGLAEDARVRAERVAKTLTWRAEVRTPGVPADARRLGDLRLECQVGMRAGLVSDYPKSLIGRFLEALRDPVRFCSDSYVPYVFFADHPVFAVRLEAGERKETLSVAQLYAGMLLGRSPKEDLPHCDCQLLLDRAYMVPLGDDSWPDDTLVELEYMNAPPLPGDPLQGWTKRDISALFGEPSVLRFDSGVEVWAYRFGAGEASANAELTILFDASGAALKSLQR